MKKEKTGPAPAPTVSPDTLKSNEIARSVMATGLRPTGFRVEFQNGTAHVRGTIKSEDERQRILTAVRGNAGVTSVNDGLQIGTDTGFGAPAAAPSGKTYTVKKGDTLSEIAQAHYGKASEYKRIFEANRDVLSDPDEIKPGQVLKLP